MMFPIFILNSIDDFKEIQWEKETVYPFIKDNIEPKETDNIDIVKLDYDEHEAKTTFTLDNGEFATGYVDKISFDRKQGEEPVIRYRYNDKYTKHVSDTSKDALLKYDGRESVSFSDVVDGDDDSDLFGIFDAELHLPKDFLK